MKKFVLMAAALAMLSVPTLAQTSHKSSTASGKTTTATSKPHCTKGKPCGNSCIAKDKVCHK
jgi:hypothetical protein